MKNYHPDAVLISNPDVQVDPDAVRKMKAVLDTNAEVSVVAPMMMDCQGRYCQWSVWRLPKSGWGFLLMDAPLFRYLLKKRYYYKIEDLLLQSEIEVDVVSGALLMVRTADFVRAGYYDEELFLYCEESVMAMKLKEICKCSRLLTDISYLHYPSTTIRKSYQTFLKKMRLLLKSKKTVLKKYYGFQGIHLIFFYMISAFCYVYAWIRGLFA